MIPTITVQLTREELIMIWQALELRTATLRCGLSSHGPDGFGKAGRECKKNQDLAGHIQSELRIMAKSGHHFKDDVDET